MRNAPVQPMLQGSPDGSDFALRRRPRRPRRLLARSRAVLAAQGRASGAPRRPLPRRQPHGVSATRSPNRPNAIGLASCASPHAAGRCSPSRTSTSWTGRPFWTSSPTSRASMRATTRVAAGSTPSVRGASPRRHERRRRGPLARRSRARVSPAFPRPCRRPRASPRLGFDPSALPRSDSATARDFAAFYLAGSR